MESKSESPVFSVAAQEIPTSPVRPSGFVALFLGLLSSVVLLSAALLIVPIFAIAIGLFALRPAPLGAPVGRRFAMAGILLAVLFATWSVVGNRVRSEELAANGQRFAAHWLELASMGEWEVVLELMKWPERRQSPKMPLEPYYANTDARVEEMASFKERQGFSRLVEAGDTARWAVFGTPHVFSDRGEQCVRVRFVDQSAAAVGGVWVELQRRVEEDAEAGEWKVRDYGIFDER
ncbi:hypothetical protein [Roseimaritima ulvae]|uniref:Uncharacterized protein n=1 Tax=Roseimaritima ulvae TaxID=980254 RepID=A0A5B9QI09_9BACT|nr:hypothetical protein [Roseimaritima ulvae]QEG38688.1 hypothetical protein UC8_06460 [Roseimaritima ulvae]